MTESGEGPSFDFLEELKGLRRSFWRLANAAVVGAIRYADNLARPGSEATPPADEQENEPRKLPSDKMAAVALQFMEGRGISVAVTADELAYAFTEEKIYRTPEQAAKWLVRHGAELAGYMDQDQAGLRFEDVSGEVGLPGRTFAVVPRVDPVDAWRDGRG